MEYVSTRGSAPALDFAGVTLAGLASDGGLYLPREWPRFSESQIAEMAGLSYVDLATRVMAPFVEGNIYNDAKTFLSIHEYGNVARWAKQIAARPAVKRGRTVTKVWGDEDTQLRERHSAEDFEGKRLEAGPPT